MKVEEMLGKYKLRDPSADLKVRIALATKNEWKKPGVSIEFRRSLWQVASALAASFLIALTGTAVNSGLTSQSQCRIAAVSFESSTNIDKEVESAAALRMRLSKISRQPINLGSFVKNNEMLNEELRTGG